MSGIDAVNYHTNNNTGLGLKDNKDRQEKVAAGVGGAAGLTTSATKYASKRGLKAEAGEKALQTMMETVQKTTRTVTKNTENAKGLWTTFKHNIGVYSKDIMTRLSKLKNNKIIGPVVKSPITKKLSFVFGGALAFFVLVTGVNKAIKTGAVAVDDFKHQYSDVYSK